MRERLSLRSRLLIAVAAVTLVALVIADVVVYASIRSYLYQQVDATLEASHRSVEMTADNPQSANANGATSGAPAPPPSGSAAPSSSSSFCAVGRETAPGLFLEVLDKQHKVVTSAAGLEECAAFQPGSKASTPQLPKVITGFQASTGAGGENEPTVYFTAASSSAGGSAFRVRASILTNGDVLIVAEPIDGITNTLSQLLLVEVLVTAGALIAASLWVCGSSASGFDHSSTSSARPMPSRRVTSSTARRTRIRPPRSVIWLRPSMSCWSEFEKR